MEDSNKIVHSFSSPNLSSSGNNENESENHRNFQGKTKSFMAPTISASSKATPPKKKILSEWKPPILEQNSDLQKLGNSNSTSRKSLPKIPSPPCLNNMAVSDGNSDDGETFVPDSSAVPYDPLTNYLSPRPKFLRYRPNRKREILLRREEMSRSSSPTPCASADSQVFSTADSSLEQENGKNESGKEEEVVEEEEEDEEGLEEENGGFKWVVLKCLVVFSALFLLTMYISSMNNPEPRQRGLGFEYEDFGNMTSRIVSLRTLESGIWVFHGREESKMGLPKIEELVVEHEGTLAADQMQTPFVDEGDFKDKRVEIEPSAVEAPNQGIEIDNEVSDSIIEDGEVQIEVVIAGSEHNEVTAEENVVDCEDKVNDAEPKINDENPAIEIEILDDDFYKEIEEETRADFENEVVDFEEEYDDKELAAYGEEIDAEHSDEGINLNESVAVSDSRTVDSESKSKGEQAENVAVNSAEDFVEGMSEGNVIENQRRHIRLSSMDLVWVVISPLLTLGALASSLLRFYCRCKKVSSKTRSSSVKLRCQGGMVDKSRPGLPPKVAEKVEQVQKVDHSQLNLPSVTHPIELRLEKTPARIIPKVKQLGEFEVGVEFTSSLKSCSVKSEINMRDESIHSVSDGMRTPRSRASISGRAPSVAQPSSSEFSTAESQSYGSYISQERTSKKEDGKEEVNKVTPAPRRSSRLRSKGVTSP